MPLCVGFRLVSHCEYLLDENQEQLLLKVLHVLRLVVVEAQDVEHFDKCAASNALYQRLMQLYLNNGGESPKKCKPTDERKFFFWWIFFFLFLRPRGNDEKFLSPTEFYLGQQLIVTIRILIPHLNKFF